MQPLAHLRRAAHALAASPSFSIAAVLSLGLGIGANTAIFGLVNALLIRPLPVREPDRLVRIGMTRAGAGLQAVSHAEYADLRSGIPALEGLIAHQPNNVVLTVNDEPAMAQMEIVSANYFDVLGVGPTQGRGFVAEEDRTPDAHAVMVISHDLWQRSFGGDAGVAGRAVRLNGHPFVIVGIAPPEFTGTFTGFRIDLWVPVMMQARALPSVGSLENRDDRFLMLIGRLRDGATARAAATQLDLAAQRLAAAFPEVYEDVGFRVVSAGGVHPFIAGIVRAFLALLMGMVGLVLLIACANLANLMMVRVASREREIAVRSALGAGRWQVAVPFLMEGVVLAMTGGAVGMAVAYWATRLLSAWRPDVGIPIGLNPGIDVRVLLFAVAVTFATALLFTVGPALHAGRAPALPALRESGAGGFSRSRVRNVLVVSQVALSALLLFGAAQLLRSLRNAQQLDPGFDASGVVVLTAAPELLGYDEVRGRALWTELTARARRLPQARSAALGLFIPLGDRGDRIAVVPGNEAAPEAGTAPVVPYNIVSPGYLEVVRIRLLHGRDFQGTDTREAAGVAIVTAAMAERFWPGRSPLGQLVRAIERDNTERTMTVIGVAADAKLGSPGEAPQPAIYLPFSQWYRPDMVLHVRGGGPLQAQLADELRSLEPDLPATITAMIRTSSFALLPLRLASTVLTASGILGLFLAATGVFGVIAYSVSRQVRDIAIRMALGAAPWQVRRMVVKRALRLTTVGLALGLLTAISAGKLLRGLLYGVSTSDPVSILLVTSLFLSLALLAAYSPARRASGVDPAAALRRN